MANPIPTMPEDATFNDVPAELACAIGAMSINWTIVESALEALISAYLNLDGEIGRIITTPLGNNTRCNILEGVAHASETEPESLSAVLHGITLFNRNREHRNTIMHSFFYGSEAFRFLKLDLNKGVRRREFIGTPDVVWDIARDIKRLFHYLMTVEAHVTERRENRHIALPDKLPLPNKLTLIPLNPSGGKPPPQSSRE